MTENGFVSDMVNDSVATPTMALQAELAMTRFVVQRVLMPVVIASGIVGNIINIAVLTRRSMKSSTNHYLSALAVYDVLYLALVFVIIIRDYMASNSWYIRHLHHFMWLSNTCSNTGVWLTVTFTVERYIGVCHPMRGKVWCTPKRARFVIIVVCLAAAIITFPEFFEFKVAEVFDPLTNTTELKRNVTWFGSLSSYSIGYKYANQTLFTFLPLILLLVFNSLLVRQVMSATAQRSKLVAIPCDSAKAATASRTTCSRLTATEGASGHRKETYMDRAARDQHRITVMLIIVVVVFLLCQLPQAIQHIYKIYHVVCAHKPAEYEHQVMRITGNVFNFLVMVNCATNFILYSAFSTKFRATFSQLFCRCNDTSSGWSRSCYCNCCYGTATAARDRTRNTAVAGRYAALNAGGRPTTGRTGRWEADNRLGSANPFVWRDKNDVECEKEEDAISALTHTPTTIDKLTMSPDQEPEDITHL